MEKSFVLLCKGCTPWQGLLLTVSFLTSWHLFATAQVITEAVPPLVAEGDNVLFLVHNLPKKIKSLTWFKGLTNTTEDIATYALHNSFSQPGSMHSGRETIYHNGSLLLEKANLKDTGFYTLRTYNRRGKILTTAFLYLRVHSFFWKCGRVATCAQPTIESVPPRVAEGRSVLLLIRNPPENIVQFVWFKGMVDFRNLLAIRNITDRKPTVWGPAYTGREMLYSDGSLLIHSVTQKDPGVYILRILRTDMRSEEAQVQLQVDTSLSPFCRPFTSSQLIIHPVPRYAAEGESVLLQVHNLPDLQALFWYKSEYRSPDHKIVEYARITNSISWGPAHRKGMVYTNGSLILQNVTEKDASIYTLAILNKNFNIEKAHVEFHVQKYVTQPFVRVTANKISGGTSVIFTCISPDTDTTIRWIFNKTNLHLRKRMTLSPTKCGLKIDPIGNADAGEYRCEVSNRVSSKTSLPVFWP